MGRWRKRKRTRETRAYYKSRVSPEVFRTYDPVQKRTVVVKRYTNWRESLSERDVLKACASVPHVVRMHRWFSRQKRGYIVMEYVRGETVKTMVERRGALPPHKVITLALNILVGLDGLHRHRFVHGDLHSDNVIVSNFKQGRTKIIDLQHAVRINDSGKARAKRTLAAPPFKLAPESRSRTIDERYDIYGVGYICACMLTGKLLQSPAQLAKFASVDSPLWTVVKTAMRGDARQRYASAREMFDAMRALRTSVGR